MAKASTAQGGRLQGNVRVIKEGMRGTGMRKIRCPKCQNLATPRFNAQGKSVLKCMSCGVEFTVRKL